MVDTPNRKKSITLTQEAEQIFKFMTDEQRRLSFSLNSKLVIPQKSVKKDFLCSLCQAILVEPMKCVECKSHFHQACLNKFCRETGSCPMQCKKPKFISVKKELEKGLNELRFACPNQEMGCDKVLTYQDAMTHDINCKYQLVKCQAYSVCKTKCIKKEIDQHQSICPNYKVPCIYCLSMIPRIEMAEHENITCLGTHPCQMCGISVTRDEIKSNSHSCFNSLAVFLGRLVEEKDAVIEILREELNRKNKQILQFIEKQTILEGRLQKMEDILSFESEFVGVDENGNRLGIYEDDLQFMNGTYLANQKNQDSDSVVQLDLDDASSTDNSSSKVQGTVDYYENEIPEEVIQKNLSSIPEEFQDTFIHAQSMLKTHQEFLKHPEWEIHTRSENSTLYTRVSNKKLICLKSKSIVDLPIQTVFSMIQDLELKPKYDQTFECGHYIQDFPLETAIVYYQYRKILLVSPRDMIMLVKIQRLSPNEIYIMVKTIELDSYPPKNNIVRADCFCGGWRIKSLGGKKTKVIFYSETDFKINQFITKQVISKTGHLALSLKKFVETQKNQYKDKKKQK